MTENKDFLTIKEAIIFTGKSEKTIRRLVKSLVSDDSQKEAIMDSDYPPIKTHKKGKYLISKEFLTSHFSTPMTTPVNGQKQDMSTQKLIQNLEEENTYLKKQLEVKDQQIQELNDANRETTKIYSELIANQQKLTLVDKGLQNVKKGFWQRLLGS